MHLPRLPENGMIAPSGERHQRERKLETISKKPKSMSKVLLAGIFILPGLPGDFRAAVSVNRVRVERFRLAPARRSSYNRNFHHFVLKYEIPSSLQKVQFANFKEMRSQTYFQILERVDKAAKERDG
uniref:Uncharacterized protein n=1 Tax=Megaselia scalaris TaxID=36166 RepID=T1GM39_MEGSC